MSADETPNGERGDESVDTETDGLEGVAEEDDDLVSGDVRERLEEGADKAIDQFDEGLIDLLAWILETETRARIYVQLRQEPRMTSEEIADGTGLYPSTVREALASLHDEDIVTRQKRQNSGAGNNPFEYSAIPPSELVTDVVGEVQKHLNAVFNLDEYMDRSKSATNGESDPVTITVTEQEDEGADSEEASEGSDESDKSDADSETSAGDDETDES
jgi:predicted transcriptional regulator